MISFISFFLCRYVTTPFSQLFGIWFVFLTILKDNSQYWRYPFCILFYYFSSYDISPTDFLFGNVAIALFMSSFAMGCIVEAPWCPSKSASFRYFVRWNFLFFALSLGVYDTVLHFRPFPKDLMGYF